MELFESAEQKSERQANTIQKLIEQNQRQKELEDELFDAIGIPLEAFADLLDDLENFSPEWRRWIESEQKKMSEKLKTEVASVANRHEAHQTLRELQRAQNWIQCR